MGSGLFILDTSSGGTVTSVGLSAPAQFSVGGSPVVGAGTLALSWVNQAANIVLAGPTGGGAAAPTFRSLVAADIPALSYVTSVGLSLPAFITVSGSPVTGAGTLTGTLATQVANTIFAGPTTGADAAPTFRTLVAADIPSLSGTYLPLAGGTLTGNLLFTDNSFDIGASGATRPRDIFLSRNATVGGTLGVTGIATFSSTSHMVLPSGTDAQRPGVLAAGQFRYNTTANKAEYYNGSGWVQLEASGGSFLPLAGGTMTGAILFTDNSVDIGATGATRPRTLFMGTSIKMQSGSNTTLYFTAANVQAASGGVIGWTASATDATAAFDTQMQRFGAASISLGATPASGSAATAYTIRTLDGGAASGGAAAGNDGATLTIIAGSGSAGGGISGGDGGDGGAIILQYGTGGAAGGGMPAFAGADGYVGIGSTDVRLYRDAANVLALRNDANQQELCIYGLFSDTANYERGILNFVAGAMFQIGVETAGTGTDNMNIELLPCGTGVVNFANSQDGTAAAAGTLNNAPTAGDPAYWLKVKVNGLVRYIPCWP